MSRRATVSRSNPRTSRLFTALFGCGIAGAALFAADAGAVSIQGGDWELDIGGIVNAYYTAASCSGTQLASGVAMAGKGLGCAGENHKTTIGNGLLPSGLITKFKTTQDGIDIGGTIGIMVHAATSSGVAPNSGVDVRQAFFTLGTADAGSVKIGRDYGIFGANAILSDMTLLGAGAPAEASQRNRVALGHIGSGYTYLDNYGQITWTSPTFGGGFTFTGGVFSPVDAGLYVSKAYPQLQAQLAYSVEGFKVWAGAKEQKFYGSSASVACPTAADPLAVCPNPFQGDSFSEVSGEIGASFKTGPFGLLANVQYGKGIGILSDGDQGSQKGFNYLVQGTYNLTDKLKFGLNYGKSQNKDNDSYNDVYNLNFKSNDNITGGLYYQLTKSVTLAAELVKLQSKDYAGNTAKQYGGDIGGIIFF